MLWKKEASASVPLIHYSLTDRFSSLCDFLYCPIPSHGAD